MQCRSVFDFESFQAPLQRNMRHGVSGQDYDRGGWFDLSFGLGHLVRGHGAHSEVKQYLKQGPLLNEGFPKRYLLNFEAQASPRNHKAAPGPSYFRGNQPTLLGRTLFATKGLSYLFPLETSLSVSMALPTDRYLFAFLFGTEQEVGRHQAPSGGGLVEVSRTPSQNFKMPGHRDLQTTFSKF